MRQGLIVHIPQNQDVSYSLYTTGSKIAVRLFQMKGGGIHLQIHKRNSSRTFQHFSEHKAGICRDFLAGRAWRKANNTTWCERETLSYRKFQLQQNPSFGCTSQTTYRSRWTLHLHPAAFVLVSSCLCDSICKNKTERDRNIAWIWIKTIILIKEIFQGKKKWNLLFNWLSLLSVIYC